MTTQSAQDVGDRFLAAVATRDFPALAACFSDDVRLRALVPRGLREASSPEEATGYFQTWFGAADRLEVLDTHRVAARSGRVVPVPTRVALPRRTSPQVCASSARRM